MMRLIILALLTVLPLVVSETSHHASMSIPPQLPSQNIIQNHGTIIINHYSNPSSLLGRGAEAPNPSSGPGWGDIMAFVVFVLCAGDLWHQSQISTDRDRTRRGCPLRCPGRKHTVQAGEPRTDPSPRDGADTSHGGRSHPAPRRGRTSAAAVASTKHTSSNVLHGKLPSLTYQATLIEEPGHGSVHAIELAVTQGSTKIESPPSHDLPACDETLLSPSESPVDRPIVSTETYYVSQAPAVRKRQSVPIPKGFQGAKVIFCRPRHLSLPSDDGYQRRPPAVRRKDPLQSTLYTGSASLSITWFFLYIAVNCDGVEDPERDLPLFRDLLTRPNAQPLDTHFESLVGSESTILSITTKLVTIYLEAARNTNSRVLVLLSGSGNDNNEMCLPNGEVITEKILRNLLVKAHMKSNVTDIEPTLFVVDICRPNRSQRGYGVGLVNLPNSVFLLALCWAASDLPRGARSDTSRTFDFEQVFKRRVGQLNGLILSCHNYWHYVEPSCPQCAALTAPCDPPNPQVPEGEKAGWSTLTSLAELIMNRSPERVCEIVDALMGAVQKWSEWEQRNTITTKQNPRGATMPMSQGAA